MRVRLRILHVLRALRRHPHRCEQGVDLAGAKRRDAVGDCERHEFHLQPQIIRKPPRQIGIIAFLNAGGIDETPGRIIALDTDYDLAAGFCLVKGSGIRRCGRQNRQQSCRQSRRNGCSPTREGFQDPHCFSPPKS
ncbi:hypothetical protein D3C86_1614430 [compost metagenome]